MLEASNFDHPSTRLALFAGFLRNPVRPFRLTQHGGGTFSQFRGKLWNL
jgi:hypothetical protein